MKRMKIVGVALIAVFALSAFAVSSASALPEVGRCVAKAAGKYTDSNCTVKAVKGNGTHEWLKSAVKTGFTSAGGVGVLEGASNVECKTQTAVGKYDADGSTPSIKAVEDVVSTFHGCAIPTFGIECNSAGQAAGVIVTAKLAGNINYISGEKTKTPVVGQELTPEVKNGAFATFECGAGAVKIITKAAKTNCIIAPVTPPNVSALTVEQNYKSTGSKQEPQSFQKTPTKICQLESTVNGGAPEKSGQKLITTVTNEEALEIKA